MMEVDPLDSPRQAKTLWQPRRSLTSFPKMRLQADGGHTSKFGFFLTLSCNSRPRVPCHSVGSLGSASIPCPHHWKTTLRRDKCSSTRGGTTYVPSRRRSRICRNTRSVPDPRPCEKGREELDISHLYNQRRRGCFDLDDDQSLSPSIETIGLRSPHPLGIGATVVQGTHQHRKVLGRVKPKPLTRRLPIGVSGGRGRP